MNKTRERGRPDVEIDLEVLKKLCVLDCSNEELAAAFGCSERTIVSRRRDPEFAAAMNLGKALGNISIRRKQHRTALKGNVPMLIFLGKQRLGQKDRIDLTGKVDLPPPKIYVNFVAPKKETGE
jgi:hypothetical protein